MIVFPVKGIARFSDDFAMSRPGGRTHEGIDIFAATGTPTVAVDSGLLRFQQNTLGGNAATVTATDGTRYYYAHLDSYEGTSPRTVRAGEVIGYVGKTGNAIHTDPHLHFTMTPKGETPINPYSELVRLSGGEPLNPALEREIGRQIGLGGNPVAFIVGGILIGGAFLLIRRR